MKCINCKSSKILENVGLLDRGHNNGKWDLTLVTQDDPHALFFKENREAPMRACVCQTCGFVMMFANIADVENLSHGKPPSL